MQEVNKVDVDKRKFFRIYLPTPLCADLSIIRIKGNDVKTGTSKVCIKDIGPGGLAFISKLNLPVDSEVLFRFSTTLFNKNTYFRGRIVRLESGKIYNKYGVEFIDEEAENFHLLNLLSLRLRDKNRIEGCRFCTKDKQPCDT